jgi:hypothetical protein
VTLFGSEAEQPKRRPAMKTFITALALVFALATVTSVIVLHGDHANVDQGRHKLELPGPSEFAAVIGPME